MFENKHYNIESSIARLLFCIVFIVLSINSYADAHKMDYAAVKYGADSIYTKGEYRDAAKAYASLLKEVQSADIYYNIGNCYYRLNEYPLARLSYERAFLLDPSNKDIRTNLNYAISKIKTNNAKSQSFISVWMNKLCYRHTIGGWLLWALASFTLMLITFLLYYFGETVRIRKIAFSVSVAFLFIMALSFICAGVQTYCKENPSMAIVLENAEVRQSPSNNSGTIKEILPGTKIDLEDDEAVDGWIQVSLGSGNKGWIKSKEIGIIKIE